MHPQTNRWNAINAINGKRDEIIRNAVAQAAKEVKQLGIDLMDYEREATNVMKAVLNPEYIQFVKNGAYITYDKNQTRAITKFLSYSEVDALIGEFNGTIE